MAEALNKNRKRNKYVGKEMFHFLLLLLPNPKLIPLSLGCLMGERGTIMSQEGGREVGGVGIWHVGLPFEFRFK